MKREKKKRNNNKGENNRNENNRNNSGKRGEKGLNKMGERGLNKSGISYAEIFIAFGIFLAGLFIILYFFVPFFKPEYRTALEEIQKNFEKNFLVDMGWYNVGVNDTGCISFPISDFSNITLFTKNLTIINFSSTQSYVSAYVNEKEFYLINSSVDLGSVPPPTCNNFKPASVFFLKATSERIINESAVQQAYDYDDYALIKNTLLPGFKLDFNITIENMNSIGKPLPSAINIFSREKIYKKIKDGKIDLLKVRFYVWR